VLQTLVSVTGAIYEVWNNTTKVYTIDGVGGVSLNHTHYAITPIVPSPHTEGTVYWDSSDHTLNMMSDKVGSILQIGQENWVRVVNKTGATLTDGSVVYISGAQGNRPTATPAVASSVSSDKTIGMVTTDIPDNQEGYVTVFGVVNGFNTSSFSAGDELWLHPTVAGTITNVKPTSPNNIVRIGYALNSTNNGKIFVNVHSGIILTGLATSGIVGDLVLLKQGTTTRNATFQDASYIVAGTNIAQTFSALQTFTGTASPSSGTSGVALWVSGGTIPLFSLVASGAAADEKIWDVRNTAGTFSIRAATDAYGGSTAALSITRTGTTIGTATFAAGVACTTLTAASTSTLTAGSPTTLDLSITCSPASASSASFAALTVVNSNSGSQNFTGSTYSLAGATYTVNHFSTGTCGTATGMRCVVNQRASSGQISTANGAEITVQNLNTTTAITQAHGVFVRSFTSSGGGITTAVGIRVENQTVGTTNYAILTGSGRVSLGDTTASTSTTTGALTVAGAIGCVDISTLSGTIQNSVDANITRSAYTNCGFRNLAVVDRSANGYHTGVHVYQSGSSSGAFLASTGAGTLNLSVGGLNWDGSLYGADQTSVTALEVRSNAWRFGFATGLTAGTTANALTYTVSISSSGVASTGNVVSSSATAGIGYATGAGGTVTQITSRTTGVTINKVCGQITLVSAAGTAAWQSFTVTNSAVAATDTIRVCQASGTDIYMMHVTAVAAGSFRISFATTGGTTTEQPVFNFTVFKAVTA
jgi:hypothetical protein